MPRGPAGPGGVGGVGGPVGPGGVGGPGGPGWGGVGGRVGGGSAGRRTGRSVVSEGRVVSAARWSRRPGVLAASVPRGPGALAASVAPEGVRDGDREAFPLSENPGHHGRSIGAAGAVDGLMADTGTLCRRINLWIHRT